MTTAFQIGAFQFNAFQEDAIVGVISATDAPDTALFVGGIVVVGTIDVIDALDTASIEGTVYGGMDTHDGFTKDEIKRLKRLQKKQAQLEAQRVQARLDKRHKRRQAIFDAIQPPVAQKQQIVVESEKPVEKQDIDLSRVNADLIRVNRQIQALQFAVSKRMQIAQLQTELAIMEAKAKAELDDEEALLILL